MRISTLYFASASLLPLASATPISIGSTLSDIVGAVADTVSDLVTIPAEIVVSELSSVLEGIAEDVTDTTELFEALLQVVEAAVIGATPTSISEVSSVVEGVYGSPTPTLDPITNLVELLANGIIHPNLADALAGYATGVNSYTNVNTETPDETIYPQKESNDAPYSVSESDLRGAIYIPSAFEFGAGDKVPVILSPGTGSTGGETFGSNFAPLLAASDFADPVWLNIPINLFGDVQVNAEYVAYAINYISGISQNKNVSLITWSQGSLDTQWALKYWPSTREVVSDFIPLSGDFHGTTLAFLLAPEFPDLPSPPSIYQQDYNSNFIATLRADGGDSAYVPTTTVYSIFDEVVQPQVGTDASSYILDTARSVGVSNNELQSLCPDQPAGGFYTHEGVMYNAVAWALAKDAITHDGPADLSRIDLATECAKYVADGLTLDNVVATEGLIPLAIVNYLLYPTKVFAEPAIMSYAA